MKLPYILYKKEYSVAPRNPFIEVQQAQNSIILYHYSDKF